MAAGEDKAAKAERIIAKMLEERGYIYPEWEYLAREDPDFAEAYDNLYPHVFQDGAELPAKYRELVAVGILATRGLEEPLRQHVRRALRLGATKREVLDALQTTLLPGGAPAFLMGLKALTEAEQEE